ncbi:MAG: putative copper resistance-related lipoprotein [Ramlibacter sp.]|nr:putative copper resistance-related lipoprotein [Ramlibacter sp.]
MNSPIRLAVLAAAAALLAGCASVGIDQAVQETNASLPAFTGGKLELSRGDRQGQARQVLAAELLSRPVSMDGAVRLALANSPAVQALIAQSWADMAAASQAGRLANPVFTFERMRLGGELEIGRLLSIGLLDLLALPQRQAIARNQLAQAKLQLAVNVVDQVSQVRQAWVRAVGAQQVLGYAEQVNRAAQASAELARRMEQAGNFSKLQRARQHAFYADAAAQLASASHAATSAREELVRQLGLTDSQARSLQLPERLPDLPKEARSAAEVSATGVGQRLDVQLAQLDVAVAGKAQGLNLLATVADVEAGVRHDTVFDNATGQRSNRRGFELDIRLPVFDWGGAQRASMNARTLLAANRYDSVLRGASSQLRESYSAYRTAFDLARHYRDEIVPLRQAISEQNGLRYNAMLIGVFELLADTRDQIATVMAAINAEQQFWLADAALASTLVGKPIAAGATPVSASTSSNQAAH